MLTTIIYCATYACLVKVGPLCLFVSNSGASSPPAPPPPQVAFPVDTHALMVPQSLKVRLYVLQADNLTPMDGNNASDPCVPAAPACRTCCLQLCSPPPNLTKPRTIVPQGGQAHPPHVHTPELHTTSCLLMKDDQTHTCLAFSSAGRA